MDRTIAEGGAFMRFPVGATALFVCFWTANAARAQACSPDFDLIPSPNAPGNNVLTGVAAIADDDIWAVGYSYTSTTHFETLTEHWDGGRWMIVASPSPSPRRRGCVSRGCRSDSAPTRVPDPAGRDDGIAGVT